MRTDRDGAPLTSVDAEDAGQRASDAEVAFVLPDVDVVEQVTRLLLRDPATDVDVVCEWLPPDDLAAPSIPADGPAGWRVTVHLPGGRYVGTGGGRLPELADARALAKDLLALAVVVQQARLELAQAENALTARAVRAWDDAP